ncbi:MAG: type II toxin-antitoxin system RelB/DinJ family antitoxin [Gomphosphaeria aponina SAG 52.96 = DSM 107014]|uniref:Type II toxin-antitoxin system RelB/DinJ family antitoxin n=1 Tax=Gomphosphaeria aponina SAG 52.96 = DSM 107014 TaxID=1521640 RepID=A0A941JMF9_9CHRO|nr:type II toxin-antitoxin system RelB/DinJ family antitoxin [Gomphosphaeria aponina SAG 52.96 = DSM 107014]
MKEKELINISIESEIKTIAEEVFSQFGMTKSEAIALFYQQVALTKNIPFALRNFNQETVKAMEELDAKSLHFQSRSLNFNIGAKFNLHPCLSFPNFWGYSKSKLSLI